MRYPNIIFIGVLGNHPYYFTLIQPVENLQQLAVHLGLRTAELLLMLELVSMLILLSNFLRL